ncbi:MAG: tetratricopeptide repeat protein, partial [Myxococcales bacterium]|nr:tetratricopeptide repeat protein [Myxococcales bacterium]
PATAAPPAPPAESNERPTVRPGPMPTLPAPSATAELALEDRSFALAEKLAADTGTAPQAGPIDVDEVINQFKQGVKDQVDLSDTATHYDLGIAYVEMGLHDEAIEEFKLCLDHGDTACTAQTMIGLSYVAKGEMAPAVAHFEQALAVPACTPSQQLDLLFELGNAYDLLGKASDALIYYEQVEERDANFRDVQARIERLGTITSDSDEVDEFDQMFDDMILKD